jgi:hypothetical protein
MTILPAAVVVPSVVVNVFVQRDLSPWMSLLGALLAVPLAAAAVRSCFLGVWLKPEMLVARTWWRTIKIPRADLVSCVTVAYWGAFTEAWTVQYLRELEVGTRGFQTFTLGGSIAFWRKAGRLRRAVLAYIRTPAPLG